MSLLILDATARQRLGGGLLLLGCSLLLALPRDARAAEARPRKAHWRLELDGSVEWLPGHGRARSGYGFGIGAGYGVLSFGVEYSRYELALHDTLHDEYLAYHVHQWFPLVAALHWELTSLPLRLGAEGALGFGVDGRGSIPTSSSSTRTESPTVLRGRAELRYFIESFAPGPFVGYAHNFGGGTSSDDGSLYLGPDPLERHYERRLPFGFELGLGARIWMP